MRPFKFVLPLLVLFLFTATPAFASTLVPRFTDTIVQFFLVSVGIFFILTLPFKSVFKKYKYHSFVVNFLFASLPAYLFTLFSIRSALRFQYDFDPSFMLPIFVPIMMIGLLLTFLPLVLFDYIVSKMGKWSAILIVLICLGFFSATLNQFIVSHLADLIELPNLLKAP